MTWRGDKDKSTRNQLEQGSSHVRNVSPVSEGVSTSLEAAASRRDVLGATPHMHGVPSGEGSRSVSPGLNLIKLFILCD
jgi:hypothetical protein